MKVVIIGGGTAGISTATHLRRRDENAEIIILEKSDEFGVSSCGLTYLLGGTIKDPQDLVGATVEQMRDIFKIEVSLNAEVIDIERKNRIITLAGGAKIAYDKLVLASGSLQLRPDISGILGDNIFTIRDIVSIEKIKLYYQASGAKKVLIMGGGNVGLQAAEAFLKLGAKVSIVEEASHLMSYFDAEMTDRLEDNIQKHGVKVYLSSQINAFSESFAELEDGTKIDYDVAIIASGVRPDLKLPIMADLPLGKSGGVLTNEYMQTLDDDIFAAGSAVEMTNLVTNQPELWPSAPRSIGQGQVIANYLSGLETPFKKVVPCEIAKIFDLTVAFVGANETQLREAEIDYHRLYLMQNNNDLYMPDSSQMLLKLLFGIDGSILGLQIIGQNGVDMRTNVVANLIRLGAKVQDLARANVAYAPEFATAKDALQNLGQLASGVLRGELHYFDYTHLDTEKNLFLVDVRSPQDFATGHLPNALSIPLATIRNVLDGFPRNKKIVLYCNRGYGAYIAYCILRGHGFDNAYLLNTPHRRGYDL